MARQIPDIISSSLTSIGRRRLANEDAFHSDPQLNLHLVCDGIGGQPSGEAASQIIAYSLSHLLRHHFSQLTSLDQPQLHNIIQQSISQISTHLHHNARAIPALKGMGATLVGSLIHAQTAHIFNAGDSRAYLLRDNQLTQISNDHTRQYRHYNNLTDTLDDNNARERRLLCNYVGSSQPTSCCITALPLQPNDILLLCTDGLTDPVSDDIITRILTQQYPVPDLARVLVEAANRAGGPDNITVTVIKYQGTRPATPQDQLSPYPPITDAPATQLVTQLHQKLDQLQHDLRMLYSYAEECSEMNQIGAFAAIKRWLGPELYANFLSMSPSQSPIHAFHHAFTLENSPWRKAYTQHIEQLHPLINSLVTSKTPLSPLMHPYDTAAIIHTLWKDWHRVEQLYFQVAASNPNPPNPQHEQIISKLIKHLAQSANTFQALLNFFPQYSPIPNTPQSSTQSAFQPIPT